MTPEREEPGRGPRQDKADPALRFDKGADIETPGPKAKGRPAGAWKKTAARMIREQRPSEAEPVAPDTPARPTEAPAPEQTGAGSLTGPELPLSDDPPEGPADNAGASTSGQSVPKYRQHSKREMWEPGASSGKFRRDSKQAQSVIQSVRKSIGAGP